METDISLQRKSEIGAVRRVSTLVGAEFCLCGKGQLLVIRERLHIARTRYPGFSEFLAIEGICSQDRGKHLAEPA